MMVIFIPLILFTQYTYRYTDSWMPFGRPSSRTPVAEAGRGCSDGCRGSDKTTLLSHPRRSDPVASPAIEGNSGASVRDDQVTKCPPWKSVIAAKILKFAFIVFRRWCYYTWYDLYYGAVWNWKMTVQIIILCYNKHDRHIYDNCKTLIEMKDYAAQIKK